MDNSNFGGFTTPLTPKRLQSQLGKETRRLYKEGKNSVRLSLARVVKVNYRYNTVDVITISDKNAIIKNPTDNGKFSARLPVSFGGKTSNGDVYGTNTLVTTGSVVLIGFLEGNKDQPIVINIYGEIDNQSKLTRTTFTGADDSEEAIQRELWEIFSLYPSMTYHSIDGRGNVEETFSGRSFKYITGEDPNNEYVNDVGFEYRDLPNSRYADGKQIEPKSPASPTVLYVHQGVYDAHRVTFFIKSDGTVRVGSRHLDGKGITFQEMNTDGSFAIVQKRGTDRPEDETDSFSQFRITEKGNLILESRRHKFEITDRGVFVNGNSIDSGFSQQVKDLEKGIIDSQLFMGILDDKIVLQATQLDTLEGSLTEQDAQITVAFDEINTKVSRTEYNELVKSTNQMIHNSGYHNEPNLYGEGTTVDIIEGDPSTAKLHRERTSEVYGIYLGDQKPFDLAYGDPYTFAFEGDFGEIEEINYIYIATRKNYIEELVQKIPNVVVEGVGEDGRYSVTFTPEDNYSDAFIIFAVEGVESDSFEIKKAKLESGEVAGEWDRSYKDYAIENSYSAEISHLADSITATVSALESVNDDIGDHNRRLSEAESKITATAITNTVTSSEKYTTDRQIITDVVQENKDAVQENKEATEALESNSVITKNRIDEVENNVVWKLELISSKGTVFKSGNIETTITAQVYRGKDNVTDTYPGLVFIWTLKDKDGVVDEAWGTAHEDIGNVVTIISEDVFGKSIITCDVAVQ